MADAKGRSDPHDDSFRFLAEIEDACRRAGLPHALEAVRSADSLYYKKTH